MVAYKDAGSLVELEESSCTGASGIGPGADDGSGALATSEEHLLTGHSGAVVCLAMYQDHLLFSGSTDCTIKVVWPPGDVLCVEIYNVVDKACLSA